MQTVMNDPTALKTGAGEQSRGSRRGGARARAAAGTRGPGGAPPRRRVPPRAQGDATYVSGGRGASLARWTAALAAAVAGYVSRGARRDGRALSARRAQRERRSLFFNM